VKGFERAKVYREISVGDLVSAESPSSTVDAADDAEKATVSS